MGVMPSGLVPEPPTEKSWMKAQSGRRLASTLRKKLHSLTRDRVTISSLDRKRSLWVKQQDLGRYKVIRHNRGRYRLRIPDKIDGKVTLRLSGLGRAKGDRTGDLLIHVRFNKGEDVRRSLWLPESAARKGADKILHFEDKRIQIRVPKNSYNGLVLRLRGLGKTADFRWRAPLLRRHRGDVLVKLFVYPDSISEVYRPFSTLSTEDMALEGWVYRKMDLLVDKLGESAFLVDPVEADTVADLYNEQGWRAIFDALRTHLRLTHLSVGVTESDSIRSPGSCLRTVGSTNMPATAGHYYISIHEQFLDNPFSVAAILAHELCHVVYAVRVNEGAMSSAFIPRSEGESLEEERTVDLLVFMFKIGEFQLRVARDRRFTLGYFNQEIFERIQVIVSKKLGAR